MPDTSCKVSGSNICRRTGNLKLGMIPTNNKKIRVHEEDIFGTHLNGSLLDISATCVQRTSSFGKFNGDAISYTQSCQTCAANPIILNYVRGDVRVIKVGPTDKLEVNGGGLFDWDSGCTTVFWVDSYHRINTASGSVIKIFIYGSSKSIYLK